MKVSVNENKVFVTGSLYNEELEIEATDIVKVYVVGCDLTIKDSYMIRLVNWITGKSIPRSCVRINDVQ
jgi:hypothetical protein